MEFRYTEPIQPTKIQQVLYGQVLSSYIKREVVLETLLKSVESKFKCLLVEDENLLEYPGKGFSIVRISATKSAPLGSVGQVEQVSPTEMLLQLSAESNPVRLNIRKETKPGEGEEEGRATADPVALLTEAGQTMDVHEPLKRIEKALEIICQEAGITATK